MKLRMKERVKVPGKIQAKVPVKTSDRKTSGERTFYRKKSWKILKDRFWEKIASKLEYAYSPYLFIA